MKFKFRNILLWLMPAFYLLVSAILLIKGLDIMSKSQNLILGTAILLYAFFRLSRAFKSIRIDDKEVDD